MKLLTLPRTVGALEYQALRLPATLLQNQVVVRYLAEESRLRLGFERILGTLDEKAGALLANDALAERGRVLRRRSEVLDQAVELEQLAEQRKQAAEAVIREGTKKAERTRTAAKEQQAAGVQAALRIEEQQAAWAEQQAQTKVRAEQDRIVAQAEAKVQAVEQQVRAQKARISASERQRTAAPKAQLEDAVDLQRSAEAQRSKAARLGQLASAEKQSRKAARG